MKNFYYLIILLSTFFIPFIFSFHPQNPFSKKWKNVGIALLFILIIFIPWDILFTREKIWGFNHNFVTGFLLLNLPIEEWLFFIVVNFAVLFIFHLVEINLKHNHILDKVINYIYILFIIIFFILNIISLEGKTYTFIVTFFALLITSFIIFNKDKFFKIVFLITFLISLVPFLIVNGALTGMFTSSPIVYYDSIRHSSIYLFTIPFDDIIYNYDMILLGSYIYYYSEKNYNH